MFFKSFIIFLCITVHVVIVDCEGRYDLYEGERCVAEKGLGTCTHIYKCLSSALDLKNKMHPPICSFQDIEPVICCTDCDRVNDTRLVIVDNDGGVFFKTGRKAIDKCIEHLTNLPYSCPTRGVERIWDEDKSCYKFEHLFKGVVVGGEDVDRSRYPHMALLGYGDNENSAQWLCGGSLISDRFILTAGHCISTPALGPVMFIAMGILKRSDPDELWRVYKVKRRIPHPKFKPPSKYHDIALLETDRKVKYTKDVFPACLNVENDINIEIASAIGWGKLGKNRPLADNLQEVSLVRFSVEQCAQHYPSHRNLKQGYDQKTQMCYGDSTPDTDKPKDTCEGDSGGPLQVTSLWSRCLHTVIGVTSYGKACGYAGDAGMYTKVDHYVPWIESIVWT